MGNNTTQTKLPDPVWIAPIYNDKGGEDFLGLRAVQGRITDYLLPGIITITPRARYYPFYSWLLVEYGSNHPKGWSLGRFIHRREQIFVLANLAYNSIAEEEASLAGMIGSIKLRSHWKVHQERTTIPLSADDYLQAALGGYNAYTGVMQVLHLTRLTEDGDNEIDIPPRGQELANAFTRAIKKTKYYKDRAKFDTAKTIPRAILAGYGEKCHLSHLTISADGQPTLEALFAFEAQPQLPPPDSNVSFRGNMRGTLALILDILGQTTQECDDDTFRQAIVYGLCPDYQPYQPAVPLRSILAHWQMFQLREYYVYALYSLWCYFLYWLHLEGRQSLKAFREHLQQTVDLDFLPTDINLTPAKSLADWSLGEWFEALLDKSRLPPGDLATRCQTFAQQSQSSLNEHAFYGQLDEIEIDDPTTCVGTVWMLLSSLYLRLRGLQAITTKDAWYWARAGGMRRRSLDLFVKGLTEHIEAQHSVLDALHWLYRDYIIAQHTITALEKWQQRQANTFHFNYEEGLFEWLQDGQTGFSASRFDQAYTMLEDLGLFELDDDNIPHLTVLGKQTLQRVLAQGNG